MRSEDIFEAITDISDKNLETRPKKRVKWLRYAALAAALALIVGIAPRYLGGSGGGPGGGDVAGGSSEGGSEGTTTFMSYAGPAFPLTTLGGSLKAERSLVWDFSPWTPVWYSVDEMMAQLPSDLSAEELASERETYEGLYPEGGYNITSTDVLVQDSYKFAEGGQQTLVYPFVSSLRDCMTGQPSLTLNGSALGGKIIAGDYGNAYVDASVNGAEYKFSGLNSWKDYKAMLSSGEYQNAAVSGAESMYQMPVTVYRAVDIVLPESSDKAVSPNLTLTYEQDYEKTTVISYGFSGGKMDRENNTGMRTTSLHGTETCLLIAIGEPLGEINVAGYRTGAVEEGNELAGVSAKIVSEESTLGEIMLEVTENLVGKSEQYETIPDHQLVVNILLRTMEKYEALDRGYFENAEDLISHILDEERVFYFVADASINAGDELNVSMRRKASFDFHCARTENQGVYGYDMVTKLGSSIEFTGLSLGVENFDRCEIVRQNIGLDPENGKFTSEVDANGEHYYLEVREG